MQPKTHQTKTRVALHLLFAAMVLWAWKPFQSNTSFSPLHMFTPERCAETACLWVTEQPFWDKFISWFLGKKAAAGNYHGPELPVHIDVMTWKCSRLNKCELWFDEWKAALMPVSQAITKYLVDSNIFLHKNRNTFILDVLVGLVWADFALLFCILHAKR